jgi:hypothetical protein
MFLSFIKDQIVLIQNTKKSGQFLNAAFPAKVGENDGFTQVYHFMMTRGEEFTPHP